MFENRVQVSRLSGVDGLVCNAGNLELDALVNCQRPISGCASDRDTRGDVADVEACACGLGHSQTSLRC